MRNFSFPSQDASIYEFKANRNSGLDEILEVGKSFPETGSVRSLIQFDLTDISSSLVSGLIPQSCKFDLILYVAHAKKLERNQTIELSAVSQSWMEGAGYFYQDVIQEDNGTNWISRSTGSDWATTGSITTGNAVSGTLTSAVLATYLTVDVSDIVQQWLSGTIENNGFLCKFPDSDEMSGTNKGNVKFFSSNTHTIYRPTLVAKWNDQVFVTGTLSPAPSTNLVAVASNTKSHFNVGELATIKISARQDYPLKTFDTRLEAWKGNNYLPSSSYFKIVDEQSGMEVIPFDDYSKISTNVSGSYFKFKVQNMYPYRYYRILLKVENEGSIDILDNNTIFTVR